MSPAEIVDLTDAVAATFGEDIAHDACLVFLEKRPVTTAPLWWWRRTARYLRNDARAKYNVRRAPRYWTEQRWSTTSPSSTPEQWAACWELVDRIPAEVTLQLVLMEGTRADHTIARMAQRTLRRHAMRYARWRPS